MMYLIYMAVFLGLYAVFKNHIFVAYINYSNVITIIIICTGRDC